MLRAVRIGRRVGATWLLRDAQLTIEPGRRYALEGPSGSGKSVLLRALAGLDPLSTGWLEWQGHRLKHDDFPRFRSQVIYFMQRPVMLAGSVEDNLRAPLQLRVHRHRQFDLDWIQGRLQDLGRPPGFLRKPASELSGGERQLLAVLRGLQLDPQLVLLDEPTAALDATATALLERLLAGWLQADRSRASVWVTHDAEQARRVADCQWSLIEGRLHTPPAGRLPHDPSRDAPDG